MEWTIAVICGASGAGKSTVARPLAWRRELPLVEADDLVTALTAMTSQATHPWLHRWQTDPACRDWSPDEIVAHSIAVADQLAPAFRAVLADHLEYRAPVVIEGDYLLPDLAVGLVGVRAVVISEPDEQQIVENLRRREPGAGEQRARATVSVRYDAHLTERARHCGVPVVPARPFDTLLARVDQALVGDTRPDS